MRKQIGVVLAVLLYYSGLTGLARWWMQRSGPRLIILNYHRATGGDLRHHLLYLRRHYHVLHLEEALEEFYDLCNGGKQGRDRRTLLALTFDDGYYDNYTHAFTLACELQFPITIFLIPGYIGSGDDFWWLEGERLVCRAQVDEVTIEGHTYHLPQKEERDRLARAIDTRLRHASSVAEREASLLEMREALAVSSSKVEVGERAIRPLTWEEVHKMEESGWVSFGGHTMHHPILAYLTDPAEVKYEVRECRRVLEQRLGHPVRIFAYPVGRPEHIGETLQAVREAGYTWAVTTVNGINAPQSDPHLLRRVLGDVSRHWLVMAAETSSIWKFFSRLWKNPVFGFDES